MDFLEGILLGPDFSDTIYQERKSKETRVICFFAFYIILKTLSNIFSQSSYFLGGLICLIILPILMIISPWLSNVYYNQSLLNRFLILFFQLSKKGTALSALAFITLNFISQIKFASPRHVLEKVSDVVASIFSYMSSHFYLVGMILAGIFFVSFCILLLIFIITLVYALPNIGLYLVNIMQGFINRIFYSKNNNPKTPIIKTIKNR